LGEVDHLYGLGEGIEGGGFYMGEERGLFLQRGPGVMEEKTIKKKLIQAYLSFK